MNKNYFYIAMSIFFIILISVIIGIILAYNDNKISITFSSQNTGLYKTIKIDKGTKLDLNIYNENLEGFEFIGWYSSPTLEKKIDDDYIFTTNKTIYSGYSKIINLNQIESLNEDNYQSYTIISNNNDSIDYHQINKLLSVGAKRIDLRNCKVKNNILTREMFRNSDIKEVILHDDIYSIEDETFENCYYLEDVSLSNSLVIIKENAFKNCVKLKNVIIKEGLVEIKNGAFYGCLCLKEISLPASLTTIGETSFINTPSLEKFIINEQNQYFTIENNILYSNDYTTIIKCPEKLEGNVSLFTNTVIVAPYAFYNSQISNIVFGNSISTIGKKAFYNCSNLKTINIPSNNEYIIEESAFENCNNITRVIFEKGLKSIKKAAFRNDIALCEVDIINSTNTSYKKLEEIGDDAFFNCTNLIAFEIPASVTDLGDNVFYNCIKLNTIVIGNNISIIKNRTFYNCYNLENVTISGNIITLGDGAFYNCKSLSQIDNIDSITTIGYACFYNCETLNNLNISNVVEIKEYAFYNCTALGELLLPNITTIKTNTFINCQSLTELTCEALQAIEDCAFVDTNNVVLTIVDNANIISENNLIMSADKRIIYYYNSIINNDNITIPKETEEIYNNAFSGKQFLANIDVDAENNCFDSIEGVLTNKEKTVLISYPGGNENINYTVPNSINMIKAKAFITNYLQNIIVGNNVTLIENNAFAHVENLEKIKLPFVGNTKTSTQIKTISCVFSDIYNQNNNCVDNGKYLPASLKEIEITNDATISNYAFYGATNIEKITFNSDVVVINSYAFYDCYNLKEITFMGKVSAIKSYAFGKCSNIEKIKVGYNSSIVLDSDCLPSVNNNRVKIYIIHELNEEISITSKKLYKNKFFTVSASSRQWDWFFEDEVI